MCINRIVCLTADKSFLESLHVDVNGEIMTPGKRESFPDSIIAEKRKLKEKERKDTLAKTNAKKMKESDIVNSKSIFNDESASENETDMFVYSKLFVI